MFLICNNEGKMFQCSPNMEDYSEILNECKEKFPNEVFIATNDREICEKFFKTYSPKIVVKDGEIVDIEELPIDDSININSIKTDKIYRSKELLNEFLQNNPLQFTDGKFYSVTKEKQTLLANALQVYQMKVQAGLPATLKWNATGEECVEWTFEDLSALAIAVAEYVEPLVAKQQSLEVAIRNSETQEELDAIEINYDTVI